MKGFRVHRNHTKLLGLLCVGGAVEFGRFPAGSGVVEERWLGGEDSVEMWSHEMMGGVLSDAQVAVLSHLSICV